VKDRTDRRGAIKYLLAMGVGGAGGFKFSSGKTVEEKGKIAAAGAVAAVAVVAALDSARSGEHKIDTRVSEAEERARWQEREALRREREENRRGEGHD